MLHLITGGSGSGKSRYAEGEILKLGPGRRIYIATMYPSDEESPAEDCPASGYAGGEKF